MTRWAGRSTTSRRPDGPDDTLVVLTSDHGEQLGDHGLIKYWASTSRPTPSPASCAPRAGPARAGRVVDEFTEAVDLLPTIAELLAQEVPVQCDGTSLVPFLDGGTPERWRTRPIGSGTGATW